MIKILNIIFVAFIIVSCDLKDADKVHEFSPTEEIKAKILCEIDCGIWHGLVKNRDSCCLNRNNHNFYLDSYFLEKKDSSFIAYHIAYQIASKTPISVLYSGYMGTMELGKDTTILSMTDYFTFHYDTEGLFKARELMKRIIDAERIERSEINELIRYNIVPSNDSLWIY